MSSFQKVRFRNNYFLMRHGESLTNRNDVVSDALNSYPLTEAGKRKVTKSIRAFLRGHDRAELIFCSPVLRARQTAKIVKSFTHSRIILDRRLKEMAFGVYSGKPVRVYHKYFRNQLSRFTEAPPVGETWRMVKRRMLQFFIYINKRYYGKNILIISHGDPLWLLKAERMGLSETGALRKRFFLMPKKGVIEKLI